MSTATMQAPAATEADLLAALAGNAADPEALTALAALRARQGRIDEALERYAALRAAEPGRLQGWYNAGLLLLRQGRVGESEQLLHHAIQVAPQNPEPRGLLGVNLYTQTRYKEALETLGQALQMKPEWPDMFYYVGVTYSRLASYKNAKAWLERALAARPNWPEASGELGITQMNLKMPEAEAELRKALAARPNWPEVMLALGGTLRRQGRHEEALECLRQCISAVPAFPDARRALALTLEDMDRIPEAIELLQQALAQFPDHPDLLSLAARLLLAQERFGEARPILAHAVAKHPHMAKLKADLEAIDNMGDASDKAPPIGPWPATRKLFDDYDKLIRKFVLRQFDRKGLTIAPGTNIFTFGSCFANNLAKALAHYPLKVNFNSFNEEANSTYANRYLFDWVINGVTNDVTAAMEKFLGASHRDELRDFIANADVCVMTLGVAPCFFSKKTGEFVFMTGGSEINMRRFAGENDFRTTTVAENVENINAVLDSIGQLNPRTHVILSLSPVPLRGSFEMPSAVIADCLSKSTLRIAIEEVLRAQSQRTHYWPSFEMIKWLGAHREEAMFGMDDQNSRHVNWRHVDTVIRHFIATYGDEKLAALHHAADA